MKRARDVRDQIVGLMERVEVESTSNPNDPEAICKAITSGFFYHVAKLQRAGTFRTLKTNNTVEIHPSSALFRKLPRYVIYHELVLTTKEFMRQVTEIDPKWLLELAPHYYKPKEIEDTTRRKMPRKVGRSQAE